APLVPYTPRVRSALAWHANANRTLVLVGRALVDETPRLLLRALHDVQMEGRLAVPPDAEPAKRPPDLVDGLLDLAVCVGVLDAQEALAAAPAREEPVEEERPDPADVQKTRRRRRHADSDGHAN